MDCDNRTFYYCETEHRSYLVSQTVALFRVFLLLICCSNCPICKRNEMKLSPNPSVLVRLKRNICDSRLTWASVSQDL